MPTIEAIHQIIIPGEKDKDPQRKIVPGKGAASIVEVSDDVAEDLINRGAARKITKAEAKEIANGDDNGGNPAPEKETAAQKKAREKREADEAKKNQQQNVQKQGGADDNNGSDLV